MSATNDPASLTQKSMRAGIWSMVQNASRELVGMLVFLALARFFLNETQIGIVAFANILIIFTQILARQGLGAALIQYSELSDEHKNAAFWTNVTTGVGLTVTIMIFANQIATSFGEPDAGPILQVLSLGVMISGLSNTHEALLIRELKFKSLAIRTLAAGLISAMASLIVAMNGGGIWSLVVLNLLNGAIGLIVLWKVNPWRPNFRFDIQRLRELFPVSLSMTGIGIVVYLNQYIDQFVVGSTLGAAALGFYYVAQRLVRSLLAVLTQSINSVSLPSFSKLKSDPVRIRRGLKKAISLSTFVGVPAFVGLFLVSEELIIVLLGENWIAAASVLRWLCIAAVVRTIVEFNGNILIATGRAKHALIMVLISTVIMIGFGLVGVQYGATGVAAALASKNVIMLLIWTFVVYKYFEFDIFAYLRSFSHAFIITFIMSLVVILVRYVTVYELEWDLIAVLPLEIIAGVAAYIAASIFIAPHLLREIAQHLPIIRHRLT